jgi:methionyl-tRNA formyltransferase
MVDDTQSPLPVSIQQQLQHPAVAATTILVVRPPTTTTTTTTTVARRTKRGGVSTISTNVHPARSLLSRIVFQVLLLFFLAFIMIPSSSSSWMMLSSGRVVLLARAFSVTSPATTMKTTTMAKLYFGGSHHHHHHHWRPKKQTVRCFQAATAYGAPPDDGDYDPLTDPVVVPKKETNKKRVVFLGTPEVAAETLTTLHAASRRSPPPPLDGGIAFEIVTVVTQPPRRGKRRNKLENSPVQRAAETLKLSVLTPEKANDPAFLDEIEALRPDLCITAAYGQYLPQKFLSCPTFGTVNIHPSLLPKYRGASPLQRALQHGDDQPLGVSVLYTVRKMDAGPIIAQQEYYCTNDDKNNGISENATILLPKLFAMGTSLLLDRLPDIFLGDITMTKGVTVQDESLATNAPLIDATEAELRPWQQNATTISNHIRAFSMWPQPYCYLQVGTRDVVKVKLLEARVVPNLAVEPTNVVAMASIDSTNNNNGSGGSKQQLQQQQQPAGLRLVCYDGSVLEIYKLCPATRNPCPARDFQNGYPNEIIRWVRPPPAADPATSSAGGVVAATTTIE